MYFQHVHDSINTPIWALRTLYKIPWNNFILLIDRAAVGQQTLFCRRSHVANKAVFVSAGGASDIVQRYYNGKSK